MANIQIPESLFYDILRYYVITTNGQEVPAELDKKVFDGLTEKIQKIADRELYTAPTEEEREKARQKYLDSKGIPESFRW